MDSKKITIIMTTIDMEAAQVDTTVVTKVEMEYIVLTAHRAVVKIAVAVMRIDMTEEDTQDHPQRMIFGPRRRTTLAEETGTAEDRRVVIVEEIELDLGADQDLLIAVGVSPEYRSGCVCQILIEFFLKQCRYNFY